MMMDHYTGWNMVKWIEMSHLMSFDPWWSEAQRCPKSSFFDRLAPPAPLVWQMQHLQTWVETMTPWQSS
jgi:hypothetical protein